MALIQCPECGQNVSSYATSCPKCAHPFTVRRTQTIQQTGKLWKSIQLVGTLATIAGVVVAASGEKSVGAGILLIFAGLIVFIVGRIGGWWFHG